ncbi:MAG: DNA polymerase III subunit delta' [Crocinitomicaceae bacterium]
MQFKDVIGHHSLKTHLIKEVSGNRISHAQMLLGPEGSAKLPLAIAFAQYLLCDNPSEEDSCGNCPHCQKVTSLAHPDLHFAYPVVVSKANKVAASDDVRTEWNEILKKEKYFNLNKWLEKLDSSGKNPIIAVEESRQILRKLSIKSYSNRYKIMIIWLPERMNNQSANKLLKLLEEPPEKTIFLMVCDNSEMILPTIISRTQIIRVPALKAAEITQYLSASFQIEEEAAEMAARLSQGNLVEAIETIRGDLAHQAYFDLFVKLMRSAYAANPNELMDISDEISALDKEKQKNFIKYGLHLFRESIIMNYMKDKLLNLRKEETAFLQKFARFINNKNITELQEEFNSAYYHLERNANPKILFTDLIIKLTKLVRMGI